MKRIALSLSAVLLLAPPLPARERPTAQDVEVYQHAPLGLAVLGFSVDLPPGRWEIAALAPREALDQAFLLPAGGEERTDPGRRAQALERRRRIESDRWSLQGLYHPCAEYARTHEGVGPASFADLDREKFKDLFARIDRSPWSEDAGKDVPGPFFFLVPGVRIAANQGPPATGRRGEPLVLELRPYVDDGKQWVLLNNGQVERREVDHDLIRKHGLKMSFVTSTAPVEKPAAAAKRRYGVLALLKDGAATAAVVTLKDRDGGATAECSLPLAAAKPGKPDLLARWASARALAWRPLLTRGESPILRAWAGRLKDLYGVDRPPAPDFPMPRDRARNTDAFSVLGGRAALAETLQMELLRTSAAAQQGEPASIPISAVTGVEVKSHPFERMLAGGAGGRIPLADHVPPDRLFVHFAKPAALFPFLEEGGDFLFRTGSLATKSAVDDDLKGRYLRRLGLGEKSGRKFLESGEVLELAVVAPDLFFIDGTDVTVLLRVKHPDKVAGKIKELGLGELKADEITEKDSGDGGKVFWARRKDLLIVSSSRTELEAVLALGRAEGAGSLGRSAEFRYMLTQLPPRKETRAYGYLSDPFIRRMVGPAVKIGQLRRMRARAEMELITAGALLYLLDGGRERPALERLVKLGYVPAGCAAGGYRLRDDLSVDSPVWGSPAVPAGLGAAPVAAITPTEEQAYKTYVDEYSRYWRQYFDPVALRLDDAPGDALELTTFILPLLDSQIYDQVRGVLATREGGRPLRVPVVKPDPVLLLSLNFTEDAWVKATGGLSEAFSRYTGISPALFDLFGPGLHIAMQDADPIIALGNADIFGGFAGPMFATDFARSGLPLLLSVLTRPCKILVELEDEQAARALLRRAATGASGRGREVQVEFRQVGNGDAWIYAMSVAGVVKLRFGIEIRTGFLVLSNIPWSQPVTVDAVENLPLNGADLQIAPGGVRLGLPGLFATESEQNQLAAVKGMAALYPLLLTVSADPAAAAARHAALFGARPLHPGRGDWIWQDGGIASSTYGTAARWQQPAYATGQEDFGIFVGVERLSVNMQLEEGGLRAVSRWTWKGR